MAKIKTKEKKDSVKVDKKEPKRKNQPVPPIVTEAREQRAYYLFMVEGLNQYEITEKLNTEFPRYELKSDHQAVAKMIERVKDKNAKKDKEKLDEVFAESVAIADYVKAEARQAWQDSKGMKKKVKKQVEKPVEQTLEDSVGDHKFLLVVQAAQMDKAKLYGVAAPKKLEVTGKDGKPLGQAAYDLRVLGKYLTDEQIDDIQKAAEHLERAQRDYNASLESGNRSGKST